MRFQKTVTKIAQTTIKIFSARAIILSLSLSLLAPSSANAAPNDLTPVASAAAAAAQLVDAGSGITVVGGSESIFGYWILYWWNERG